MPWRPPFDEPLVVDPTLDTFRDSVARLTSEGSTVGFLACRVTHVRREVGGHLWWRRWGPPDEVVEWMQTMVDAPAGLENRNDGWVIESDNPWLASVRDGRVDDFRPRMEQRRYQVEWLTGPERDLAWDEHGFGRRR